MNLPDAAELRELVRHMTPDERDELSKAIFAREYDYERLSDHELERFAYLLKKLRDDKSLLEALVAFNDDEANDFFALYGWLGGDERPTEHPFISSDVRDRTRQAVAKGYRAEQPLSEAQRIARQGNKTEQNANTERDQHVRSI